MKNVIRLMMAFLAGEILPKIDTLLNSFFLNNSLFRSSGDFMMYSQYLEFAELYNRHLGIYLVLSFIIHFSKSHFEYFFH